jgi:hypothetical protein
VFAGKKGGRQRAIIYLGQPDKKRKKTKTNKKKEKNSWAIATA